MATVVIKKPEPKHVLSSAYFSKAKNTAGQLAAKLGSNAELTAEFTNAIDTDFKNKLTTSAVHFSLVSMFDDEEIAKWPRWDSVEQSGEQSNVPFNKFKYKDLDGKEQETSWWRLCADQHPIDLAYKMELKAIEDAGKGVKSGASAKYYEMGDGERERAASDIGTKRAKFYEKLRDSVKFWFAKEDVNNHPKLSAVIEVNYATVPVLKNGAPVVEDGEVLREIDKSSPRIVEVKDKVRNQSKYYTIANFLRFNIDLCLAKGGTYGDFITSNKRPGDSDGDSADTANAGVKIDGVKVFEDYTIAGVHFLNGAKASLPMQKELIAYYTAAEGGDRRDTLFKLAEVLTFLTGDKRIKDKYEAEVAGTTAPAAEPKKEAA